MARLSVLLVLRNVGLSAQQMERLAAKSLSSLERKAQCRFAYQVLLPPTAVCTWWQGTKRGAECSSRNWMKETPG